MPLTSAEIDAADEKLQALIKSRGGSGILGIARNFRIIDVDKSGHLDKQEFGRALELFRAGLSKEEEDGLFDKYDRDASGTVSIDEYLFGIRGALNKTRKALINRIFHSMDTDFSGELTIDDLRSKYDTSENEDVKTGKKTADEVLGEFLASFEGDGGEAGDGVVTSHEWLDYYTGISSSIDNDDMFLMLICNTWGYPYVPLMQVQNVIKSMQAKVKSLVKGYDSEEKTLMKQFKIIDKDSSGEVDMEEFKECMKNMGLYAEGLGIEETNKVELLFILFDEDASDHLSYKEFAHAALTFEI